MKIIKSHEEPSLLVKNASERIEYKTKGLGGRMLSMLSGTLDANLLRNIW